MDMNVELRMPGRNYPNEEKEDEKSFHVKIEFIILFPNSYLYWGEMEKRWLCWGEGNKTFIDTQFI